MTTPSRPTLEALEVAMKGKDTTDKWDVVVSYALEQLNQLLASQYQVGKLAQRVQLQTQYTDDFDGDTKTVDYDLRLSSPTLAFNSQAQGTAILTMTIAKDSSYTVTPTGGKPETTSFPVGRYSIQCVVPLATLSGTAGTVQDAKTVITFEDGKEEEQHIILDFSRTADTDYQIVPAPDPSGSDLDSLYLPLLANYFRGEVSAIDYALTSINNKSTGDGIVLKPKQFVLATSGTLGTGTLSIYIVTDASGRDPGNTSPVFQPDGTNPLVPVPSGYAASIILSYDLITNVYFRSQLEAKDGAGKKRYTVKVVDSTQGGIDLRLITNESVIADGKSGTYFGGGYSYDGLNIPVDEKNPMALTIVDAKYSLSWSGSTTSEWSESSAGVDTSGSYRYGSVKFTITLSKGPTSFPSLTGDELKLIDLKLSSSDFKVDKDGGKCSAEAALGKSTTPPSYYDNMKLSVPEIDLRLAGLNFFLETNLLSPGQEVVEVDRTVGVRTPHDFLLVGAFKSMQSPS